MSAAILYENGVQVSYSLNTFMPIEGYHLRSRGAPRCAGRREIAIVRTPARTPSDQETFR